MSYRYEDGDQEPIPKKIGIPLSSLTRIEHTWHPPDLIPLAKAYLDRRKVTHEARALLPIRARFFGGFGVALGFECAPSYFYERRITDANERGQDWLPPGQKQYFYAPRPDSPCLVLVEGVFDALRVWEAGFHAVALHGQSARWEELALGKPVIVLFDKDAVFASEDAALKGASLGIPSLPASHWLVKKDPGETSPAKLRELLEAALRELST